MATEVAALRTSPNACSRLTRSKLVRRDSTGVCGLPFEQVYSASSESRCRCGVPRWCLQQWLISGLFIWRFARHD
jgi:hypothetical protein